MAAWVVLSLAACAGQRNEHIATPADVEMDGAALRKFQHEIEEYIDLHQELLHRVPNVGPRASPAEIVAHRNKMTQGIVAERKGAHPGEIFKPKVEVAFRRLFATELARPEHQAWVDEILSGNPKSEGVPSRDDPSKETTERPTVAVNAVYSGASPRSSVPPTLLSKMPPIPEQVRYCFVGRDLLLLDAEANVILDFVKNAVPNRTLPR